MKIIKMEFIYIYTNIFYLFNQLVKVHKCDRTGYIFLNIPYYSLIYLPKLTKNIYLFCFVVSLKNIANI